MDPFVVGDDVGHLLRCHRRDFHGAPAPVLIRETLSSSKEGLIALLAREDEDRLTAGRIETLVGLRAKDQLGLALKDQDVVAALDLYGWTVVKDRSQPGKPITTLMKCQAS